MKQWESVNTDHAEYFGVVEIEHDGGVEVFEIVKTSSHFVFGTCSNTGLLESGNFKIDYDFSIDKNLQELIADLESYYYDGDGFQSDAFCCNERM